MTSSNLIRRTGALGLVAALALTGCTAPATNSDTPATSAAAPAAEVGTVIDVRTPDEFADGHLEGAVNIDVSQATFADEIAKLDKAGTYTVYCRSGNRSAQAVQQMKDAGFTNVADAGGFQAAADSLGLPVVKP